MKELDGKCNFRTFFFPTCCLMNLQQRRSVSAPCCSVEPQKEREREITDSLCDITKGINQRKHGVILPERWRKKDVKKRLFRIINVFIFLFILKMIILYLIIFTYFIIIMSFKCRPPPFLNELIVNCCNWIILTLLSVVVFTDTVTIEWFKEEVTTVAV